MDKRFFKAVLVVFVSLVWSGSVGSNLASAKEPDDFGSIKYAIYDTATQKLLSNGVREKALRHSDFKFSQVNGSLLYDKSIDLGDHFIFGIADDVEGCSSHISTSSDGKQVDRDGYVVEESKGQEDYLGGFGLFGERDDVKTFSWDWFDVDRPGHANKLQESGALSFETNKTSIGTEISRMHFLKDVSIRIDRLGQKDPVEPAWRIKILKGSEIIWPKVDSQLLPR